MPTQSLQAAERILLSAPERIPAMVAWMAELPPVMVVQLEAMPPATALSITNASSLSSALDKSYEYEGNKHRLKKEHFISSACVQDTIPHNPAVRRIRSRIMNKKSTGR